MLNSLTNLHRASFVPSLWIYDVISLIYASPSADLQCVPFTGIIPVFDPFLIKFGWYWYWYTNVVYAPTLINLSPRL